MDNWPFSLQIENLLISHQGTIKLCDFGSSTTIAYYPDYSWSAQKRSMVEDEVGHQPCHFLSFKETAKVAHMLMKWTRLMQPPLLKPGELCLTQTSPFSRALFSAWWHTNLGPFAQRQGASSCVWMTWLEIKRGSHHWNIMAMMICCKKINAYRQVQKKSDISWVHFRNRLCLSGTTHGRSVLKLFSQITRNTTPAYRTPEMIDLYSNYPINEKQDIWVSGEKLLHYWFYIYSETNFLCVTLPLIFDS